MLETRLLSCPAKRSRTLIYAAGITRRRPRYSRHLAGILRKQKCQDFDLVGRIWDNTELNYGQHIAMNRMLDEAARMGADYFLRIDEDCYPRTRAWLKRMLAFSDWHEDQYGRPCVVGPFVTGLRGPPPIIMRARSGRLIFDLVGILGGICRLHPMSAFRYFRFSERAPMGFGEASQVATYCKSILTPMVRLVQVVVSHGPGGTDAQERADPAWAYEHDMLQLMPYGL